jgi:hypothetical protein
MVHALDQDRPPAVIDHGDDSGQVIARRLRLGGRDDLSRNLEGQHLLFRKLRGRGRQVQRDRSEQKAARDGDALDDLFLGDLYAQCVEPSD